MHKIMWTDKQREIYDLLSKHQSYEQVRDAGYGCENIDRVISAIRNGQAPPAFKVPPTRDRGSHAVPLSGVNSWGSLNWDGQWQHVIDLMKQIIEIMERSDFLGPQSQRALDLMKEIMQKLEPKPSKREVRVISQSEIDEMFALASKSVDVAYRPGSDLLMAQDAYRVAALRLERIADWLHPSRFSACVEISHEKVAVAA